MTDYRTPSYAENDFDCYFFEKNLQGDIIAIYNESGTKIGSYTYDAWGNFTATSNITGYNSILHNNPFRYREYYYDNEIGLYYLQSRYYNPTWGRFINSDGVMPGASDSIYGYNLFVYCFNNPINLNDSSGYWPKWIKNTVKWAAKNIIKPVVKKVQTTLSSIDLTYSTGVNISGTPGMWIFNGQVGVSIDTKGNIAIQASEGGGITTSETPSISLSNYRSIANASNIDKLNGMGYQIGGSAGILAEIILIAIGGDFNIMPDSNLNRLYYGVTTTGGIAMGIPSKEFHVEWGKTVTIPKTQFNIFDVAKSVYTKIMEW